MGEKVTIQIFGREMTVEIDGVTPTEIQSLARYVTDKMKQVQEDTRIVDSSKLAMLVALELAADLHQAKGMGKSMSELDEKKIEEMIFSLQSVLQPSALKQ